MTANDVHTAELAFDYDKPTDIEIAVHLMRLIEDSRKSDGQGDCPNWRATLQSMANNALHTMTNPFARALLASRLAE